MNLIDQLQSEAVAPDCNVTNLLQKSLLMASKLEQNQFSEWVRLELRGYEGKRSSLPPYRTVRGLLSYRNPFNGICPYVLNNAELERAVTLAPVPYPIAEIQYLISNTSSTFQHHFDHEVRDTLMRYMGEMNFVPFLQVSSHLLSGVLEAVKNELLEWSLKLEKEGILGEGMSFSPEEKKKAVQYERTLTPNFILNIFGNVEGSQLQVGSPDAHQSRQ